MNGALEKAFAEGLLSGLRTADEVYNGLRQYVDHAADCMYHRTDSPYGDVCVCNVNARCRELRETIKRRMSTAEELLKCTISQRRTGEAR